MTFDEDVDYVETMIVNCGTAEGLAELACSIKGYVTHLRGDCETRIKLFEAYTIVRNICARYAGIEDEFYDERLDAAIDRFEDVES